MSATGPAGAVRLLGIGAGAARRSLRLWLLGAGFEAAISLVRVALAVLMGSVVVDAFLRGAAAIGPPGAPEELLLRGLQGVMADRVVLPLVGLAVTTEILAAILRLFYLGASVERLASVARKSEAPAIGVVAAGATALSRATLASVWLGLLELVAGLWRWVVLGAAALVVRHAFQHREHGWRAAALAGLAVGLTGVVALLFALFGRVYFVRAVRGPTSTLDAVSEAAALVQQRALTYLGILVAEGVLLLGAAMVAGAPGAAAVGSDAIAVQIGVRLLGAALSGGAAAAIELIVFGALCAADLDACGELPAPPAPPEPPSPAPTPLVYAAQEVLVAEEIVPALPLPPPPEPEPTS